MTTAPQPNAASSPHLPLRALGIGCTLATLAVMLLAGLGQTSACPVAVVAVATLLTEWGAWRSVYVRQRWVLTLADIALVSSLALHPGTWVAVSAAAGVVVAHLLRRARSSRRRAVGATVYVLSFAVAGATAQVVGGSLAGGLAAAVAFWVTRTVLDVVQRRAAGEQIPERGAVLTSALNTGFSAALGLLAATLATAGLTLVGPLLLLVPAWAAYERLATQSDEIATLNALLQRSSDAVEHPAGSFAPVILRAFSDLLSTRDAQMLLLEPSEPLKWVCTTDSSYPHATAGTSADLDQHWVLTALSSPRTLTVTHSLTGSVVVLRIGSREQPLAVLVARTQGSNSRGIGPRDKMMAVQIGRLAERWLQPTTPAGDRDMPTEVLALRAAAVSLVNRSLELHTGADRYGATAAAGTDVAAVVTELLRVQRATAGVIGAHQEVDPWALVDTAALPLADVDPVFAAASATPEPMRWISLRGHTPPEPREAPIGAAVRRGPQ